MKLYSTALLCILIMYRVLAAILLMSHCRCTTISSSWWPRTLIWTSPLTNIII